MKTGLIFILSLAAFSNIYSRQNNSANITINPEMIITLLTALLTILCSGVFAAWISHRLAKGKEELFYKRKKLEELYKSIEEYTTLLFVMNHMWLKVMDGDLSFNQGLDLQINNSDKKGKNSFPEIDMLINLYFPNFLPTYKDFIKKRDIVNDLYREFKNIYKVKGPTIDYSDNRKEFLKALFEVDEISKTFLNEVAQYVKILR